MHGFYGSPFPVQSAKFSFPSDWLQRQMVTTTLKSRCADGFSRYVARMDWQQMISLAIVSVVVALFARSHWRPRKFDFKRDTHCGCASSGTPEKNSIVFHVRKGGRPEVIVKMK